MTDDSRSERPEQNRKQNRRNVSAQGVFNRGPAPGTPADTDDPVDAAEAADEAATDDATPSETATDDVTAQGVFDRGGSLSD